MQRGEYDEFEGDEESMGSVVCVTSGEDVRNGGDEDERGNFIGALM